MATRSRKKKITEKDKERFLSNLEQGMTVKQAAEAAAHPAVTFHSLAARDGEFAEAKRIAQDVGTDTIEAEAYRRAIEGYDEVQIGKVAPGIDGVLRDEEGNPVVVRRHSDRLAEVLLKARRPEYRENSRIDITQNTLNVAIEDRSAALTAVAEVLKAAGVNPDHLLEPSTDQPVIEHKRYTIEERKP